MSAGKRFYVWRDKPGSPKEMVAGPMSLARAKDEAYDRSERAKEFGSAYRYHWYPEGVDPNA